MTTTAKKILLTGATDGLGLEAAKKLVQQGHTVLIHGRSAQKLKATKKLLEPLQTSEGQVQTCRADLSKLEEVDKMAKDVTEKHPQLDVLINNAGIFKVADASTEIGIDVRFVVNTIAPYLLTQKLLPLIPSSGRIVNLSSAAQSPVNINAMLTGQPMSDFDAYAQSKLGIIMWSNHMASTTLKNQDKSPLIVSLNPASMLGTKMVREGFGQQGRDVHVGVDIIIEAALGDSFANAHGQYFDNDSVQFAAPGGDARNTKKRAMLVDAIEDILERVLKTHSEL